MTAGPIKVIAFDLDDTLLNTSGLLIPHACQRIHSYLVQKGYTKDFSEFEERRRRSVASLSHRDYFRKLSQELCPDNGGLADEIWRTITYFFYEPEMPGTVALIEGAEDNLNILKSKYQLYIVTAGVLSAQYKKLKSLNLQNWIPEEKWLVVAQGGFLSKREAFEEIIKRDAILPGELLAIGNRLSQEIKMAKELGARTCFFKFGDHADETPQSKSEIPDFTITQHKDFIPTCRL